MIVRNLPRILSGLVVGLLAVAGLAQVTTPPARQTEGLALVGPNPKEKKMKIVFLGDSITEAGIGPQGYVTQLGQALRSRQGSHEWEIVGAGISGNKVPDLQRRLEKDVLAHKPDVVVIYIGINDVWHSQNGQGTPRDQFEDGLRDIIQRIKHVNARIILCTPSMIGEKTDGSNKLDSMLDEYAEVSRKVAREAGVTPVDLRKLFVRELQTRNPEQKASGVLTTDGVHLNDAGNQFVKDCLLPTVEGVALGKQVTHLVLFKYKSTTTQAEINQISDAFAELPKKIAGITDFRSGTDISPENLAQGFTHAYVLKFQDLAARDAYLVHPAHQEFVKLVVPCVETPLVVDFWEK